jgi:lysophospholipid acyltransferase (LPLAT)-like uncharacterized protein
MPDGDRALLGPTPAADQEDRVRFAWLARFAGRAMGAYVRLVAATSRASGPPVTQEQALFAIWHETNLAAAIAAWKLRANKRVISFSTRGFRGVVMNAMLESVGAGVVTLPEEGRQSRAEAARMTSELARLGREGWSLVVSCDGPFGPYRVAKPGALIVAREAGLAIQPWSVSVRPPFRLTGRWDRMLIPLPFGRIRVHEGVPLRIAPREALKPRLAELQAELVRVAEQADRRMR